MKKQKKQERLCDKTDIHIPTLVSNNLMSLTLPTHFGLSILQPSKCKSNSSRLNKKENEK